MPADKACHRVQAANVISQIQVIFLSYRLDQQYILVKHSFQLFPRCAQASRPRVVRLSSRLSQPNILSSILVIFPYTGLVGRALSSATPLRCWAYRPLNPNRIRVFTSSVPNPSHLGLISSILPLICSVATWHPNTKQIHVFTLSQLVLLTDSEYQTQLGRYIGIKSRREDDGIAVVATMIDVKLTGENALAWGLRHWMIMVATNAHGSAMPKYSATHRCYWGSLCCGVVCTY